MALNLSTWGVNRDYVTSFEGFDRPWSVLEGLVADLAVEEVWARGGYIATGTWRPRRGERGTWAARDVGRAAARPRRPG